jgi:hypothetical protein
MARDFVPGSGPVSDRNKSVGPIEFKMVKADTGETVWVTNKRVLPDSTILLDDADNPEITYRAGPRLGQVEPVE